MKKSKAVPLIITFALLAAAAGALWVFLKGYKDTAAQEKTVFAMDTSCSAKVWGADPKDICDEITRLGDMLDCHSEQSEISKLNAKGSAKLSDEAADLIRQSKKLTGKYPEADISIGAVTKLWNVTGADPTVPGEDKIKIALQTCGTDKIKLSGSSCTLEKGAQLDLGAVAKGYALDIAKQKLEEKNAECAVISMGSSSLMYGKKPDGEEFSVAVRDPESEGNLLKFKTGECFVSTSGGYERFFETDGKKYIHIFDIKTGRPAETDLVSVTVICSGGLKSDQLSTSIFIGGTKKLPQYFADTSIKIIAVDEQGNIHISGSLEDKITLEKSGHTIIVEK